MTKAWLLNTIPAHWNHCFEGPQTDDHPERHQGQPWHGIPAGGSSPNPSELDPGDLLIIRVNGEGVRALWTFREARRVTDQSILPPAWRDHVGEERDYDWLIYCGENPARQFEETYSEEWNESPDLHYAALTGTAKKGDTVVQPYVEFLLEQDLPNAAREALLEVSQEKSAQSTLGESGGRWGRDEYILALDLYLNHSEITHDDSDPAVQKVAALTGRSANSIALRLANFRHLDPDGTEGLSNVGADCREIWEEFYGHEDELEYRAQTIREELGESPTDATASTATSTAPSVSGTEVVETGETTSTQKIRRGQAKFRAAVRERYDDQCVLCDISKPMLLEAAHILEWEKFEGERGDPANGLLLCRNHHQAFERDLFTLSESYSVVPRPGLSFDSEWLQSTISDRENETLEFPNDPPSSEYLRQYNSRISWMNEKDDE
jgi:hypothetical protein